MSDALYPVDAQSPGRQSGRLTWESPVLKILSLRDAARNYLGGAKKLIASPPSPPPAVVRVKSEISSDTASQRLV